MTYNSRLTAISLGLITSILCAGTSTGEAASGTPECRQPRYTVTDLGVLGQGNSAAGLDMNSVGWVGGSSNLVAGGPQHAFLWYGQGQLMDLGTLGGPNSAADGPNLYGEAPVGAETSRDDPDHEDLCQYGTKKQCLPAVWRHGKLERLPLLPGGHNGNAFGINNLGEVVGWSENGVRDAACSQATPSQVFRFQAVKWGPRGEAHVLRPLPGDTVAYSFGLNDRGQAVGSSGTCDTEGLPPFAINGHPGLHAVLWERDGTPIYLGNLGGAHGLSGNATSINDRGEAVGASQFADGSIHSFFWTKGKGLQDIGSLDGAMITVAGCCRTVNNLGEVVGFSLDAQFHSTAFYWHGGKPVDLNTLVPQGSMYLLNADSINDVGEITGQACFDKECTVLHAFRATPRW
jgi:probable HAF family extracellular repeat protein